MGSWVTSSTIEDVPRTTVSLLGGDPIRGMVTDFDDDCKMARTLHFGALYKFAEVNECAAGSLTWWKKGIEEKKCCALVKTRQRLWSESECGEAKSGNFF